jgi:hypothetical protein
MKRTARKATSRNTHTDRKCQCGRDATIYAIDPIPDGWGAYFCLTCKPNGWQITDYLYPNGR